MILETKRLILRRWEESDAESLYEYAKDPDVGPIAGWPPHRSIDESRYVIKNVFTRAEAYAICLKTDHKAIGAIELKLNGHTDMTDKDDECELGYWLGKPFWGQGIMPEAAGEMLRHAFEDLGMSKVWCGYYEGNNKSKRVQEKCGFHYQWTTQDVDVPLMNEKRIGHVSCLTKEEWSTSKSTAASEDNKGDNENLAWEEIRTEHIIQDEWIDFRRSAYRFPDGSVFEPYYSYSRRDYVVIVASDTDGQYLCVRQFRQGIRKVTTEFPAGGIERTDGREYRSEQGSVYGLSASEFALETAKRELLEETGYVSDDWRYLLTVPSNATIADNYAYIFVAENCRKFGEQNLDETEFLNVRKYSAAEIEEMISQGNFQQAIHIMAWLLAQR